LTQLEEFRRKKMERQKLAKAVVRGVAVEEPLLGYTNGNGGGSSEELAMRLDDTRFPPPSPQIHEVPHDAAPAMYEEAEVEAEPAATSMATLTSHSLSVGTAAGGGSPGGDSTPGGGDTPRVTAAAAASPDGVVLELEFESSPAAGTAAAAAAAAAAQEPSASGAAAVVAGAGEGSEA